MGDRMTPIPFWKMMNQILEEKRRQGSVYGIRNGFVAKQNHTLSLFGEKMETPFGPAAGPHTQLAQNIVAAYVAGARFFELKTVQKLDGEDLHVSKPCIHAEDEGYNVEWSTELTVEQAFDEYDIVILDWMMPIESGISACKRLRENGYQKTIMMLTARDDIEDRVTGLDTGADDYLVGRVSIQNNSWTVAWSSTRSSSKDFSLVAHVLAWCSSGFKVILVGESRYVVKTWYSKSKFPWRTKSDRLP